METIYNVTKQALMELVEASHLGPNTILVIGCSTSEVMGEKIGTHSTWEVGEAIYKALSEVQNEKGFDVAFQCCEHLNRALVVERSVAERMGLEIVNAVPQKKAGGSMSTIGYEGAKDPVLVEFIKADAGIDIGDTFIGMHLKHVAVPVRLSVKEIGAAHVTAARVRPKSIGGARAVYNDALK